MNRTTQEATVPIEVAHVVDEAVPGLMGDLFMLTKARLTVMVLITTFVGFCMGSGQNIDWIRLLHTLIGTALVAGSAAALNQFSEAKVDRLMDRTRNRPLPAGRMKPSSALGFGVVTALAGFFYLLATTNILCAYLAAATLIIYVFLYTPMKRRTSFCTIVGAISGAIPPLVGWTAARQSLDPGAWILFGVLFLWQIPHFLAIAWMYRDEYAQAGFVMLSRNDVGGLKTAWQGLVFAVALVFVTLLPVILNTASPVYAVGAALFNSAFIACSVQFVLHRNQPSARRLFFASIIYLPCLLGLMVFTRI